jgi:VRR-NUC domain
MRTSTDRCNVTPSTTPLLTPREADELMALARWVTLKSGTFSELCLLFHIPNGEWRHPVTARRLQLSLVRPGVPDLFLPVPRGEYHGLFIELKVGARKPTAQQSLFLAQLAAHGYRAVVCHGWDAARQELEQYLLLGRRPPVRYAV